MSRAGSLFLHHASLSLTACSMYEGSFINMKVALLLLFTSFLVVIDWPAGIHAVEENTGENLRGATNHERHLPADTDTVKVIVKYKTDKGKEDAKKKASKVHYESERFKIIAIEIDSNEILKLEKDDDIESVDMDVAVRRPERKKMSNNNNGTHRELIEQVGYGIRAVQADQVLPGPDASKIKVCVVDTGYDPNHQDLPGRDAVTGTNSNAYSSKEGNRWDQDGDGHGTFCAGIIAAIGNNNVGVRGVIPNAGPYGVRLHIGKGLDNHGEGTISGIIEAIEGCINSGSDIISMSFVPSGGGHFPSYINDIIQGAYLNQNVLAVAAAGNDGNRDLAYPSVMSVGAVDSRGRRASFSNFNDRAEIVGPGVDIASTEPGNRYDDSSGTSMSTPYVAGVAALVWSYNASCTAMQIRRILLASALPLGSGGCDVYYGRGLVQAKAAVNMRLAGGCTAGENIGILDATGKLISIARFFFVLICFIRLISFCLLRYR